MVAGDAIADAPIENALIENDQIATPRGGSPSATGAGGGRAFATRRRRCGGYSCRCGHGDSVDRPKTDHKDV
jgi:hypothetical protein